MHTVPMSVPTSEPARDPAFAGHGVHGPGPGNILYSEGWQAMHGPPSGPKKPGSHLQVVFVVLPGADVELAGHKEHADDHTAISQKCKCFVFVI